MILIAKTGYGKSMVFHSVSALKPDTMTLMIMPLLALEEDQKLAIKKMQINSNPCILNGETMTKELLNEIQSGVFTDLLTSPEIASQRAFDKFVNQAEPVFRTKLIQFCFCGQSTFFADHRFHSSSAIASRSCIC